MAKFLQTDNHVVGVRPAFHQPEPTTTGDRILLVTLVAAMLQLAVYVLHLIWVCEVKLWRLLWH